MIRNKLKSYDDKTEFLILHSSYKEFTTELEFEIGQTKTKPPNTCRNLGVMFDSHIYRKMESQIQNICQSMNFHLNSVRNSFTDEATVLLVHAQITSRLDYYKTVLQGLPARLTNRLQCLQNIAVRVVTCCSKFDHITPVLYELHWLPVRMRTPFELLLLMYRCVRIYSLDHLHPPDSGNKSYGDRAFCVSDPAE